MIRKFILSLMFVCCCILPAVNYSWGEKLNNNSNVKATPNLLSEFPAIRNFEGQVQYYECPDPFVRMPFNMYVKFDFDGWLSSLIEKARSELSGECYIQAWIAENKLKYLRVKSNFLSFYDNGNRVALIRLGEDDRLFPTEVGIYESEYIYQNNLAVIVNSYGDNNYLMYIDYVEYWPDTDNLQKISRLNDGKWQKFMRFDEQGKIAKEKQ